MPVTSIRHVRSRCGAGKSLNTITELLKYLVQNETNHLYLFASKTNELSMENFSRFTKAVASTGSKIPHHLIDTSTEKKVLAAIELQIKANANGVLFVSHKAISMLDPKLLKDTYLIFDEIPQELIQTLFVQFEERDRGNGWEKYLTTSQSKHKGYELVQLNPLYTHEEVKRRIINVQTKLDNTITDDVARLLAFLLEGYEVLYQTQTTRDKRTTCVYQALEWLPFREVVANASVIIILSAQLKETLFGYLATHLLNLPIVEWDIADSVKLETKHRHRARIYTLLASGKWSSTLKQSLANEKLVDPNNQINPADTVSTHVQRIIHKHLGTTDYLFIPNDDDSLIAELQRSNVSIISTSAHGINKYRHLNHAAYIASNIPTPFEIKTHHMFAIDHGLNPSELKSVVVTERCYEAAYQCVARTAIRSPTVNQDMEHIFFVPDMNYAQYLTRWFDAGCATIDTSLACSLKSDIKKDQEDTEKFSIAVRILRDKKSHGTKLTELLRRENISLSTFNRYKRKYRAKLQKLGLI